MRLAHMVDVATWQLETYINDDDVERKSLGLDKLTKCKVSSENTDSDI